MTKGSEAADGRHMPPSISEAAHIGIPASGAAKNNLASPPRSRQALVPSLDAEPDGRTPASKSTLQTIIPSIHDTARADESPIAQDIVADNSADGSTSEDGIGRKGNLVNSHGTENGGGIVGVPTDHKLLLHFFGLHGIDVQPIATDSFLKRSKDEYNAAWLTREIVQNFVDHNPTDPGTLNGVRFTSEPLADGRRRFRIEGDWPFEDSTGVLSPHSAKPEDRNTAGGNGIGLKQTAIRILRDFEVDRFEIEGEGWSVNYHLAKATDVNRLWRSMSVQPPEHEVKHDWLFGTIEETQHSGSNAYVIETRDPELIAALEQLPTLGVSAENPYLQDMDYVSDQGAIKWLPASDNEQPVEGRLFINGQVMNYLSKGKTATDYWVGPEAVTIQLNNVDYQMSIDRPPVKPIELSSYLNKLVVGMSDDELVEQLKRSEHLWAGYKEEPRYQADRAGALVLIEKMTNLLAWHHYDPKEWQRHFGGKNYIAWNAGVKAHQIEELEKQGYIVCPGYFEDLGMATATSKLSSVEAASMEVPNVPRYKREEFAQEYGMEVAYETFPNMKYKSQFMELVGARLDEHIASVEGNASNPDIVRIILRGDIHKELLFHALPNPKGDEQELVHFLRGMAFYGLDSGMFQKIFTSQGDYVTTFGLNYDTVAQEHVLLARNISSSSEGAAFVEIELKEGFGQPFMEALQEVITQGGNKESRPKEVILVEGADAVVREPSETGGTRTVGQELPQTDGGNENADLPDQEGNTGQREKWFEQLLAVPVIHRNAPDTARQGKTVKRDTKLSEAERVQVTEMETDLPGISEAVDRLDALVPKSQPEASTGESAIEQYLAWRKSDHFYGQLGETSGYLTGKHLIELINEQDQADIAKVEIVRAKTPEDRERDALHAKLNQIIQRINPAEDEIDDFELVLDPTDKQLAQLGLLRLYTQLTTGVDLPNDLFIYQGTGSKGINLGQKAIGMHESLLNVKFTEALRTFVHEVAHNYPEASDHGNMFRHALESLFVTTIDRISQIANKLLEGEDLSQEDKVILDMQKEWEKLKVV